MPVSTSSLVTARPSTPESAAAWRTTTASNQPHRRGQHAARGRERRPQLDARVGDERAEPLAQGRVALVDGVEGKRRLAEQRLEIGVLLAQVALEGLAEAGRVEQVADADAGARH